MRNLLPALLLLTTPTLAQDRDDAVLEYLEQSPILVTALRRPESAFKTPYSTEFLDREKFAERQYRTTPQGLRDMPGVLVQETAPGQGSPYIRGFTGYRTLLLIDGVRLNNSTFRDGPNQYWNTVDPYSVGSFELVRGPSSVLFGSDAIGGTLQARTIDPYAYGRTETWGWAGTSILRGASAEQSAVVRAEMSVTYAERIGFVGGFTPKSFGDLRAGSPLGTQEEIGYDEFTGDAKVEYHLDDGSRLVFLYQHVKQNNVPRWHRTIFNDESFHGTALGDELQRDLDQDRWLLYGQWHKEDIGGLIDAIHLNLSWHDQSEVRDRKRTGDRRDKQGTSVGTLGLWAQLESDTPLGRFVYGAEWYRDHVNSFSSGNPIQGPVADDATYDLIGAYVQDEIDFSDRAGIVLGARFNYAAADAEKVADPVTGNQTSIEDDWSAFVGSIRGHYEYVPDEWNLFGGVSQGFRAPNLSDLTRFDSARSNEFEVPAPGLDPEYFTQFEVGTKGRMRTLTVQASLFYTRMRDQIVRVPTGDTTIDGDRIITKANVGDGWIWGCELGAAWEFRPPWTLFGNFAYLEGKEDTFATSDPIETREYISRVLPMSGQVGLRWDSEDDRFWAESSLQMVDKADRLSPRDAGDTQRIPPGGTPGYAVWSVRGGWNITRKMALTLGLENLLDKSYRVHGSGQNMPGFNAVLSFFATF